MRRRAFLPIIDAQFAYLKESTDVLKDKEKISFLTNLNLTAVTFFAAKAWKQHIERYYNVKYPNNNDDSNDNDDNDDNLSQKQRRQLNK